MEPNVALVLAIWAACLVLALGCVCSTCVHWVRRGDKAPRLATRRSIREQINDHQRCIDALEQLHDRCVD